REEFQEFFADFGGFHGCCACGAGCKGRNFIGNMREAGAMAMHCPQDGHRPRNAPAGIRLPPSLWLRAEFLQPVNVFTEIFAGFTLITGAIVRLEATIYATRQIQQMNPFPDVIPTHYEFAHARDLNPFGQFAFPTADDFESSENFVVGATAIRADKGNDIGIAVILGGCRRSAAASPCGKGQQIQKSKQKKALFVFHTGIPQMFSPGICWMSFRELSSETLSMTSFSPSL
ncbi:MAG: hypothetical protein LBF93_12255, partial [Zoogloeaceae bacterium]|nr:hypothetical protein [Zoogloeaceae bacterium]